MNKTTMSIYTDDLEWWKKSCKKMGLNSADLFHGFRESCRNKKDRDRYVKQLARPSDYRKRLFGKHIDKSRLAKEL